MFVRIKTSGKNQYLQILKNVREGTKVKQHILGTLDRIDQLAGTMDIDSLISKLVEKRKYGFNVECVIFLTVLHRLFISGSDRQY